MSPTGDPETWAEALAAFDAWSDLAAPDRPAWLAALQARRAAVHARLITLIHADEQAEAAAFLGPVAAPEPVATAGLAGQHLGPWRVERLIGTGGMGQVWLARRTDGHYDGLAAIKLMRLATADAAANARFAREGRLLGRLSHPHIAKLLDAGVTPSGERYLVLEYVEGERIDRWCDARRLSVGQRVALFEDVCAAVAHAHGHLIVHRDLKPSNIFVTETGDVKLLDFGVAKLIESEAQAAGDAGGGDAATALTRDAASPLTPDYAAPEQLAGGAISTATDVYGLGLVLFGLLSGCKPFGPRAVGMADTPRPLWTPPGTAAEAQAVATARSTSVRGLRRALRGDLAVVLGKAIKPEAAERYASVPEFAEDLQRAMSRRPIAARPDGLGYRLRRYLRRHAFGVGAATLLGLALAGGVTGTLLKQREAERQAERAVAVKRFLIDLFSHARGAVTAAGTHAREANLNDLLAAGAQQVDQSLPGQPALRDEVFEMLVELYAETGDPAKMLALARQRLAAARSGFGAEDARISPAEVMLAAALLNNGDVAEAEALLTHSQALLDAAHDHVSKERARLLRWQGLLSFVKGEKPAWEQHPFRQAVALLRERFPYDEELLSSLATLPALACSYGKSAEAVAAADELYRRSERYYGGDNLHIDQASLARGQMLLRTGHAAEALAPMQAAITGFGRHLGERSPDAVQAHLQLAKAYLVLGRSGDSEREVAVARDAIASEHADDKQMAENFAAVTADLDKIRQGQRMHCGAG